MTTDAGGGPDAGAPDHTRDTGRGARTRPHAGWRWEHLPKAKQRIVWERFAGWVEQLRQTYRSTVRLPACWPRHDELVNELRLYWYWAMMLETGGHPEEAIRWHFNLRQSAEAWRRLANCDHEDPTPIDAEIAAKRAADVRHHLDLAMREHGMPAPRA